MSKPKSKRWRILAATLLLFALIFAAFVLSPPSNYFPTPNQPNPQSKIQNLKSKISFEPNVGQFDPTVRYLAQGSGYALFLTDDAMTMKLATPQGRNESRPYMNPVGTQFIAPNAAPHTASFNSKLKTQNSKLSYRLSGANPHPQIEASNPLPGKLNYFLGNDSAKWRSDVTAYGRITYRDMYAGIDLAWYGNASGPEYDFIVAAGADPSQIHLAIEGADKIEASGGDLLIHTAAGDLHQAAPHIYQDTATGRVAISGSYIIAGNQVSFSLAAYDHSHPLVIDPVLEYSSYLGGNSSDNGMGIALDSNGNIYVTGTSASTTFPVQNPYQDHKSGIQNVVVSKFSNDGQTLIYSTYIGGANRDLAQAISVDDSGSAYILGSTNSITYPTTLNPLQDHNAGGFDAFVTKLSPAGNALVYSTYIGGSSDEGMQFSDVEHIAVDGQHQLYIAGATLSANFPTHNPLQPNLNGSEDAFVAKLNAAGNGFVYSTFLGGSSQDSAGGVAIDSAGDAYVLGNTNSTNFPILNPLQPNFGGASDMFITKFAPDGQSILYSTYFGGSGNEFTEQGPGGIALDPAGNIYITGGTFSYNFPTHNALYPTCQDAGACSDAFVTKINAAGNALIYSTYLGGNNQDQAVGIAADAAGNAYVVGTAYDNDFPQVNAVMPFGGFVDAFITKFNPDGSALVYSSYIGGNGADDGAGVALSAEGHVYVTGYTDSFNFPTLNPYQSTQHNAGDFFIVKIADQPQDTPTATLSPTITQGPSQTPTPTRTTTAPTATATMPATLTTTLTATPAATDTPIPDCRDAYEPDANSLQAPPLVIGITQTHTFCLSPANPDNDFDWVYLDLSAGGSYDMRTSGLGGQADTIITLYDSNFTPLITDDDGGGNRASFIEYTVTNSGRYYLVVQNKGDQGGPAPDFSYNLSLSQVSPPPVTATPTDCPIPFTDINGNIFYTAIKFLYCRGVVNGISPTQYGPAGTSTRAQFAKVVVLGFAIPSYTPNSGASSFTDVPSSYFAYQYIEAGYHASILSGFDTASCIAAGATPPCYLPNRAITRAQLTKLVVAAAGYTPFTPSGGQTFTDVGPSNVFYVSIETAHNKGVINGYPDNTFRPNNNIRRDEMAQIVYKAITTP